MRPALIFLLTLAALAAAPFVVSPPAGPAGTTQAQADEGHEGDEFAEEVEVSSTFLDFAIPVALPVAAAFILPALLIFGSSGRKGFHSASGLSLAVTVSLGLGLCGGLLWLGKAFTEVWSPEPSPAAIAQPVSMAFFIPMAAVAAGGLFWSALEGRAGRKPGEWTPSSADAYLVCFVPLAMIVMLLVVAG